MSEFELRRLNKLIAQWEEVEDKEYKRLLKTGVKPAEAREKAKRVADNKVRIPKR